MEEREKEKSSPVLVTTVMLKKYGDDWLEDENEFSPCERP